MVAATEWIQTFTENIWSAYVQENASKPNGWRFTMQQDNYPKHTANATKEFIRGGKVEGFRLAKSISWFKSNGACIPLAGEETKVRKNPQNKQLKMVAGIVWQSISKEDTNSLVMLMVHRVDAVIACKGYATNYKLLYNFNLLSVLILIERALYTPMIPLIIWCSGKPPEGVS